MSYKVIVTMRGSDEEHRLLSLAAHRHRCSLNHYVRLAAVEAAAALLLNLTEHDWLQIEQASSGCISGTIGEWPHLYAALLKVGYNEPLATPAATIKVICNDILDMRDAAESLRKGKDNGQQRSADDQN
jgi:hypothetical protein